MAKRPADILFNIQKQPEYDNIAYLKQLLTILEGLSVTNHYAKYKQFLLRYINNPKGTSSKFSDETTALVVDSLIINGSAFFKDKKEPLTVETAKVLEEEFYKEVIAKAYCVTGIDAPEFHLWYYLPIFLCTSGTPVNDVYRMIKNEYLTESYKASMSPKEYFMDIVDWHNGVDEIFNNKKSELYLMMKEVFPDDEFTLIENAYKEGLQIHYFMKGSYDFEAMSLIRDVLKSGKNYNVLDKYTYENRDVILICKGILKDLHVHTFSNPNMEYDNRLKVYRDMLFVKQGNYSE